MKAAPHPVISEVDLALIGPERTVPVRAELRYDPVDPYAAAVVFRLEGSEVAWVFSRNLLMRGVCEPAGDGDVRVFPSLSPEGEAQVVLELSSPAGRALVEARSRDVLAFLARTTRAVWPGTEGEHVSVDAEIAALLVGD